MIRFGVQLHQEEYDLAKMKWAWRTIEELKFDSVWIYDHFYPMSKHTSTSILEAWTILPLLASETKRIRFGVFVTCNSYRFPPVLAKIAATVDVVSEGRLEFGIGAGWYDTEYEAYGILFPTPGTRIKQLDEAIELMKEIWTGKHVSFQGQFYRIKNLITHPKPVQKPYPPLWIGGKGDKLLKVAAKHADYINFPGTSVEETKDRLTVLKEHCASLGRKYEDIIKTWHARMVIDENPEKAKKKALQFKESSFIKTTIEMTNNDYLKRNIIGTPQECIKQIQQFIDEGITYFIFHFPYSMDLSAQRIFTEKVASSFS